MNVFLFNSLKIIITSLNCVSAISNIWANLESISFTCLFFPWVWAHFKKNFAYLIVFIENWTPWLLICCSDLGFFWFFWGCFCYCYSSRELTCMDWSYSFCLPMEYSSRYLYSVLSALGAAVFFWAVLGVSLSPLLTLVAGDLGMSLFSDFRSHSFSGSHTSRIFPSNF